MNIDARLYVTAAMFQAAQPLLSLEEAARHIPPMWLWIARCGLAIGTAGVLAWKTYRSKPPEAPAPPTIK